MENVINTNDIAPFTEHSIPEPYASRLGAYESRSLGDHYGVTQFGANLETLQPGSQSALRHWHSKSDELIYMIDGELTLVTDSANQIIKPGMCVGFKAGRQNAHHLINHMPQPATFLVIGSRVQGDNVHYPDDDFQWLRDSEGKWHPARKDGTPL